LSAVDNPMIRRQIQRDHRSIAKLASPTMERDDRSPIAAEVDDEPFASLLSVAMPTRHR